MPKKLVNDELCGQVEPHLSKHEPTPKGRESIVESKSPAGEGQSRKDMEKQALQGANPKGILNPGLDIEPVEQGFDWLTHRTYIR